MNSKETILLATLELASEKGLGNTSLSQIAKKIGIQKSSLYSHFSSKEEIIDSLYEFLRERAKNASGNGLVDYGEMITGQNACDVLRMAVENYTRITTDEKMLMFYKFIMSERMFNRDAARIMIAETEKMILATKQLFYAMQIHKVMVFANVDMAAVAFAMTIHSLMDYQNDKIFAEGANVERMINNYIEYFCANYDRRNENEENFD